jgi:hypothetical protein
MRNRNATPGCALTLVLALILPASAAGAVKAELDRHAGMRLTLDGRVLTAEILRTPRVHRTPPTEQRLYGKRIDAICASNLLHPRRGAVVRTRRWPAGARRLSFRFGRDISRRAKWCLIEHKAADVAGVTFVKRERIRFVGKGRGPSGAWWRLGAGAGLLGEPCAMLRDARGFLRWCFKPLAKGRVSLRLEEWLGCSRDRYFVGVVSLAAATVRLVLADGTRVDTRLFDRPRGSRLKARYFVAVLPENSAVRSVEALDAAGGVLAARHVEDEAGELLCN